MFSHSKIGLKEAALLEDVGTPEFNI